MRNHGDGSRDAVSFDFHYDRRERLAALPERARKRIEGDRGGFFTRNRAVLILAGDLAVIALVWFVFLPFIRSSNVGTLSGYRFTLVAVAYEGKTLISLEVDASSGAAQSGGGNSAPAPGSPGVYTVTFSASDSDDSLDLGGTLPSSSARRSVLHASMPYDVHLSAVIGTVHIGGKALTLKARVGGERGVVAPGFG